MKTSIILTLLVLDSSLFFIGPANAQLADSPWPMFQHDARHTGQSPYVGPDNPVLKWKFHSDMDFTIDPVIDKDGIIYVGIYGGILCALNPDKTEKWRFKSNGDAADTPTLADDTIYFGTKPYLYALNKDGSLKWSYYSETYNGYTSFLGKEGEIYLCERHKGSTPEENTDHIIALTHDGILKWSIKINGRLQFISAINPVIGADGTIIALFYMLSGPYAGNKCFYVFNPDGEEKWVRNIGDVMLLSSQVMDKSGVVYIIGQDRKDHIYFLSAINPDGTLKWKIKLDAESANPPAFGIDGSIYISIQYSNFESYIIALNPDGTEKWRYMAVEVQIVGEDGTIYVYSGEESYNLLALNPDGTLKWKYQTKYFYQVLALSVDGTIYLVSSDSLYSLSPNGEEIWCYDLGDYSFKTPILSADGAIHVLTRNFFIKVNHEGKEQWRIRCNDAQFKSSPSVGSDGTIYLVSETYLYSVNPDGTEKGRENILDVWSDSTCPAIGSDGTIYLGDYNFYAVNKDLSLKWTIALRDFEGVISMSSTIDNDGNIYFCTCLGGYLFSAKPYGILNWEIKLGSHLITAPVISDDGNIYVNAQINYESYDCLLYSVKQNGTLNWSYPLVYSNNYIPPVIDPVIGSDGTIYAPTIDGKEQPYSYFLCAINPDGTTKWKLPTEYNLSATPAVGLDDTIYFGILDEFYAVNSYGSLKWSFAIDGGYSFAASPIIDAEGTIYVPATNDNLNAINLDGSLKWKIELDVEENSNLAMGKDGIIYICSNDEYLCAIGDADKAEVDIYANNSSFTIGDTVNISVKVENPTESSVDLYAAVMLNGILFWYPIWDETPHVTEIGKGIWDDVIASFSITSDIPRESYNFYAAITSRFTGDVIDFDEVTIDINK